MATRPPHLLDLNVLIALAWPQHVHHVRSHVWFASLGASRWATTPFTEAGFVRLSTNPRVVATPQTVGDVLGMLRVMRALPGHAFIPDDSSLVQPAIDLARAVSGNQVTDLHLVNLAAGAGAVLATLDRSIADYLEPSDRRHVLLLP